MRNCPCGTNVDVDDCCGRFLAGSALPETPEQLMRSRYTAFTMRDADYLRETWHPGTRPDDVGADTGIRWEGLEIVDAPDVAADANRGEVEFRASWRDGGARGVMHERSRFVRQSGRWWYLDGVVS